MYWRKSITRHVDIDTKNTAAANGFVTFSIQDEGKVHFQTSGPRQGHLHASVAPARRQEVRFQFFIS
jgi:hypothetical protein